MAVPTSPLRAVLQFIDQDSTAGHLGLFKAYSRVRRICFRLKCIEQTQVRPILH